MLNFARLVLRVWFYAFGFEKNGVPEQNGMVFHRSDLHGASGLDGRV